jgi:predicted HAD superfamily Cof-like phosphohydrolase
MTPHNLDPIHLTMDWFKLAIPEPTGKNIHTQIGCHFEEVAEMVNELSSHDDFTARMLKSLRQALELAAIHFKQNDNLLAVKNEGKLLDAICDQVVTGTGVGYMLGYNTTGAMHAVVASNYSKFVDGKPILDQNRKIMKGPGYTEANMTPFTNKSA